MFSIANNQLRVKSNACYSFAPSPPSYKAWRKLLSEYHHYSNVVDWLSKDCCSDISHPTLLLLNSVTLSFPHWEMESDVHTAVFKMDNQQGPTV